MFFPCNVDVPMERWPIANWLLIAVTSCISILTMIGAIPTGNWMLIGPGEYFTVGGLFGSLVSHAGIFHLAGNMLFLFVFGNAVNAKIGHLQYLFCYFLIGIIEGLLWVFLGGGPALGASGAIMGILGMFIIFYPRNNVTVFFWIWYASDTFEISAYFVIVAYFLFDLWGTMTDGGDGGVAYLAHILGSVTGFGLGTILALSGMVRSDHNEQNIFEAIGLRKHPSRSS